MKLILLFASLFPALALADARPNEIIVKYKEGVRRDRSTMEQIYQSTNVVKVKRFTGTRDLEQLILEDGTDLGAAIDELMKNPSVEFAEPNAILRILPTDLGGDEAAPRAEATAGIPCIPGMDIPGCDPKACLFPNFPPGCTDGGDDENRPRPRPTPSPTPEPPGRPPVSDKPADVDPPVADPMMDKAWGVTKIGAPEAWKTTPGSQDMIVAVIDTGVDYNHEDLAFNIWRNPNPDPKLKDVVGFDVVHNDGLPFDDHAHGTHCSGVIGAVGGNGKGMSGVNRRVSIMGVKFLSADGSGDEAGAIRAIDYAVDHGAKVLSNSWGGSGSMDVKGLKAAVARAESKGVLFVAAAGNESSDNDKVPEFPGGFDNPNVFAVAATDSKDELAYFSNTGAKSVHVAAPGVDVYSSVPGNKYEKMSGTSMACPHAAGAAALLWSHNPSMTYAEVKARLMDTADKLPSLKGKVASEGRLNIAKALASP